MKKVLAVILAMLMIMVVFAGCGGGGTETSGSGSSNSEVEGSKWPSGYPFNETDFKGKTLTWCTHWAMPDEKGYQKEFMDATGAKLEFSILSGGGGIEYYTQLNAGIAAGTGPDVAVVYNWAMPTWIQKGLLLPLDTALDLSDEIYKDKISQGMLDFFNLGGEQYVIQNQYLNTYYLIYRKDLIDEAGLDDPLELYEAGEWDFDTFREFMEALTYDSNDDGVVDKYGLTGYTDEAWLGTVENGNYVRYDEEGRPKYALSDADLVEAYTFAREGFENWQKQDVLPIDEFLSGNFGFLFSAPWDWAKAIEAFGIENIGYVQMPYAPSNTSKVVLNRVNAIGYAFTNNLDVPELAEEYIKYSLFWDRVDVDQAEAEQETIDENWGGSREFYEFNKKMQTLTFAPNDGCFGILSNLLQSLVLWSYEDTFANNAIACQPLAQAEIDKIFYGE